MNGSGKKSSGAGLGIVLGYNYIHNWPLQPFSPDYCLASHTTLVVCVHFMRDWWDLQFNVDSELQIFEKLSQNRFCEEIA